MRPIVLAVAASLALLASPVLAQDIIYLDDGTTTEDDPFPGLPPRSEWHGLGWDCLPENLPPEGWLRKGGYCEIIRTKDSLTTTATNPTRVAIP